MKTYNISAEVTISLHTIVEAESEDAAREIANERDLPSISWPGNHVDATEQWNHSGELDGTPVITSVIVDQ